MPFQIIRNDITKVKADAVVNTANPKPTYGGGTDSAIYEAAGKKKLLAARTAIGNIEKGQAVETPAFALDAKYIIHTVGPAWEGGEKGEFDILKACYENSLQLAWKLNCKSIAFPLIATGVNGFPKDKALQIAMSVIQTFLLEHTMKVTLVVFDKKSFELSGNIIENIREYVDANYVKETRKREYWGKLATEDNDEPPDEKIRSCGSMLIPAGKADDVTLGALPSYISGISGSKPATKPKKPRQRVDINAMLATSEKTFQEKLFEIIDERGLTGPQVYQNYISKQVYSKLQCDKDYHPNKYTAIALCLSLHLDIDETKDLIGRAGWTLSPSNKADLVVAGCIMNGEYSVVQIDMILFDFDCPCLDKIK